MTLKETGECLEKLYSGSNNLSRAYDVVYELLRGKNRDKLLSHYYVNFKTMFEELRVLSDLRKDATSVGKNRYSYVLGEFAI